MASLSQYFESRQVSAAEVALNAGAHGRVALVGMLISVCFLALFPSATRAVPCPLSYICDYNVCSGSVAAQRDSFTGQYCSGNPGGQTFGHVQYDLRAGSASSSVDSYCYDNGSGNWDAEMYDFFHVVGPAFSGHLTFTARVHFAGGWKFSYNSYGGVYGALIESYGAAASYRTGSAIGGYVDTTLMIPLSHAVGQEFTLFVRVGAWASNGGYGGHYATNTSQLSFADLPPGYAVVSCQGFVSDPIVPVRSITWGGLKAHYR